MITMITIITIIMIIPTGIHDWPCNRFMFHVWYVWLGWKLQFSHYSINNFVCFVQRRTFCTVTQSPWSTLADTLPLSSRSSPLPIQAPRWSKSIPCVPISSCSKQFQSTGDWSLPCILCTTRLWRYMLVRKLNTLLQLSTGHTKWPFWFHHLVTGTCPMPASRSPVWWCPPADLLRFRDATAGW